MKRFINKNVAIVLVLIMIITIGANSFSYSINTLEVDIEIVDLEDEVSQELPLDPETPQNPEEPMDDPESPEAPGEPAKPESPDDQNEPEVPNDGETEDSDDPKDSENTDDPDNQEGPDKPGDIEDPDNPQDKPDDQDDPNNPEDPKEPEVPLPEFLPYKVIYFIDDKEIEDWYYEGEVPGKDPFVWSIKEPGLEELPDGYVLDKASSTGLPFEVTEDNNTIFVYYMMVELSLTAVGGEYTIDPNSIIVPTDLQGQSTNVHSRPVLLWSQGGTVFAAVKSTHRLEYMNLSNLTTYNFDRYDAGDSIRVYYDDVNYQEHLPEGGIQGNKKDGHWTVFKFSINNLYIPEEGNLTFFIKGIGGGHDVGGTLVINVPKTDITGHKVWEGGGIMPPVTLQLLRRVSGGMNSVVEIGVLDGSENTPWSYTWYQVPEYSPYGQPYIYSIDEATVPQDYEKSISGMTVTNTFVPKGEITVTKIVENYNGNQVFDIFIYGSNGKTYTLTLRNGETKTIKDLEYANYEIIEIVPMNFELVGISKRIITISRENIEDSATVTNRRTNDGWFYDDYERINNITVGVTTAKSPPVEERRSMDLELDVVIPREDFIDDEIVLEEDFD